MLRGSGTARAVRRKIFSVLRDEHALLVGLPDPKLFQILEDDEVRPVTRGDGAEVAQPVMPRGIDGGDLQSP